MKWPWKKERRIDRWERKERKWSNFSIYSKNGIILLALAFLGVMYLINLTTWLSAQLMYSDLGYYPSP